jgi:cytochrome c2
LFTWTESIAISNIIRLEEGSVFPLWEGDFLVGTFKKALFHFRVVNDRVVFMERLPISGTTGRIRDLLQDQRGRIVLYLDDHSVIFLSPRDVDAGGAEQPRTNREMLGETILSKCAACHQIAKGGGNAIGPNLFGVVGRRIAGVDDYDYSTALSSLTGSWTRERLDAYLADPQQFAPGTSMAFSLQSPIEREAVLNYLEQRQ